MRITEQRHGRAVVLRPGGPITGDDAEQLGRQINKVLQETSLTVVVDLSQVAYFDSRGLEILADVTERLIRTGGALKLACANETVREVLELTELAPLFEQYDEVTEAVESAA
ncbi:MAG: STAS domain-containing protein [Planctomycetes bacterium]|nr:STAS domain-containing protein [Planctomycetota bacterium]